MFRVLRVGEPPVTEMGKQFKLTPIAGNLAACSIFGKSCFFDLTAFAGQHELENTVQCGSCITKSQVSWKRTPSRMRKARPDTLASHKWR